MTRWGYEGTTGTGALARGAVGAWVWGIASIESMIQVELHGGGFSLPAFRAEDICSAILIWGPPMCSWSPGSWSPDLLLISLSLS